MASITIRNLDGSLKSRLRIQAAVHGRSMEDEARDILRSSLNQEPQEPKNLGTAINALFKPFGGLARGAPRTDARAADLRRMILLDTNVVSEQLKSAREPLRYSCLRADLPQAHYRQDPAAPVAAELKPSSAAVLSLP